MIYVGIDDTDNVDSPGTNQLARRLIARLRGRCFCRLIVRHQLLVDPRVPYTSKNSSAALLLDVTDDGHRPLDGPVDVPNELIEELKAGLVEFSAQGSDPGLCVVRGEVPVPVGQWGRRCQREVVRQAEARQLAAEDGVYLEGLGGTDDGVIGALAAVGLASTGDDGRIVHIGDWPDDLAGPQPIGLLEERGVVVQTVDGSQVRSGTVDVGKHLRPNYRQGRVTLFVEPGTAGDVWTALRLP